MVKPPRRVIRTVAKLPKQIPPKPEDNIIQSGIPVCYVCNDMGVVMGSEGRLQLCWAEDCTAKRISFSGYFDNAPYVHDSISVVVTDPSAAALQRIREALDVPRRTSPGIDQSFERSPTIADVINERLRSNIRRHAPLRTDDNGRIVETGVEYGTYTGRIRQACMLCGGRGRISYPDGTTQPCNACRARRGNRG